MVHIAHKTFQPNDGIHTLRFFERYVATRTKMIDLYLEDFDIDRKRCKYPCIEI